MLVQSKWIFTILFTSRFTLFFFFSFFQNSISNSNQRPTNSKGLISLSTILWSRNLRWAFLRLQSLINPNQSVSVHFLDSTFHFHPRFLSHRKNISRQNSTDFSLRFHSNPLFFLRSSFYSLLSAIFFNLFFYSPISIMLRKRKFSIF